MAGRVRHPARRWEARRRDGDRVPRAEQRALLPSGTSSCESAIQMQFDRSYFERDVPDTAIAAHLPGFGQPGPLDDEPLLIFGGEGGMTWNGVRVEGWRPPPGVPA